MAWKNLQEELGELFGQLTSRTDDMISALDQARERARAWERARNAEPARKRYKAAWQRAKRRKVGLKGRVRNGARAAGWSGLSAEQKERHNQKRRERRARAKLTG